MTFKEISEKFYATFQKNEGKPWQHRAAVQFCLTELNAIRERGKHELATEEESFAASLVGDEIIEGIHKRIAHGMLYPYSTPGEHATYEAFLADAAAGAFRDAFEFIGRFLSLACIGELPPDQFTVREFNE